MKKTEPEISILMSTYNRKDYLPRIIESTLAQTFRDFEFIIVNNGSTDGSIDVCNKYDKEDNRIRVIHVDKNHGAPIGRNAGLDAACGKYVTFIDDDDDYEPEMLEFLWRLATKYESDISICGSWNNYGNRQEPYFIFDELIILDKLNGLEELLKREKYNVAPPGKLFRKHLFDDVRFKKDVLVDDIHIIYKVFSKANSIVAQGKPLYYFTKHAGNMTSFIQSNRLTPSILTEYLSAFRERTEYLSKEVPGITTRVKYSEWSYMISMCTKIKQYNCTDCTDLLNSMTKLLCNNYAEIRKNPFMTENEIRFLDVLIDTT